MRLRSPCSKFMEPTKAAGAACGPAGAPAAGAGPGGGGG